MNWFKRVDYGVMTCMRRCSPVLARVSLFVIFFWFGVLKIVGTSAANELVAALQAETLPFFAEAQFIGFIGALEIAIAFLILIPRWERLSIGLLLVHMATTFLPLVFLPEATWQGFLTPTLEGQYIIKNLVIVAMALAIAAYISPLKKEFPRGIK